VAASGSGNLLGKIVGSTQLHDEVVPAPARREGGEDGGGVKHPLASVLGCSSLVCVDT
jgi:hypothetical protein